MGSNDSDSHEEEIKEVFVPHHESHQDKTEEDIH